MFTGGHGYDGAERLGCMVIPSGGMTERQVSTSRTSSGLIGPPRRTCSYIDEMERQGLDPRVLAQRRLFGASVE